LSGTDFGPQIEREIRAAKAVVVLWCSLSRDSRWVREEADLASKLDTLTPAWLERVDPPFGFARADTIDLTIWDGAPRSHVLDRLLNEIARRVGRDPIPSFRGLQEYEGTWRSFGAPPLTRFALIAPVAEREEERLRNNDLTAWQGEGQKATKQEESARQAREPVATRKLQAEPEQLRAKRERKRPIWELLLRPWQKITEPEQASALVLLGAIGFAFICGIFCAAAISYLSEDAALRYWPPVWQLANFYSIGSRFSSSSLGGAGISALVMAVIFGICAVATWFKSRAAACAGLGVLLLGFFLELPDITGELTGMGVGFAPTFIGLLVEIVAAYAGARGTFAMAEIENQLKRSG
jgi:hypothetical protein